MIWHKAIGKDITMWVYMNPDFFQEKIVFRIKEYSLFVVSPVVNVVKLGFKEFHD